MPETEDKPDLDELLDMLGAPDEAPRRKRIPGGVWLMLALVLSLAGIWLALHTAMSSAAAKITGPPVLPTKVSDRTAPERVSPIADVVEDYIERCKKGMTEQEVRWIVADFQKAGLDQGVRSAPPDEFVRQRKAQHAWYLDLLGDGLNLDADQRKMAEGKLAGLLDESAAAFRDAIEEQAGEPFEHEGRRLQVVPAGVVGKLIDASQWLTDERYAPWELCELTDEQKRVTWYGWIHSRRSAEPDSLTYEPGMPWFGDRMLVGGPSDDGGWELGDFSTGDAPNHINGAGVVFPFMVFQGFVPGEGDVPGPLEVQAMGCHPDQLRTLLLIAPGIGQRLLEALDSAEK